MTTILRTINLFVIFVRFLHNNHKKTISVNTVSVEKKKKWSKNCESGEHSDIRACNFFFHITIQSSYVVCIVYFHLKHLIQ